MSETYKEQLKDSKNHIAAYTEIDDAQEQHINKAKLSFKQTETPQINQCAIDYCMRRFKRSVKSYHMQL